MNDKNVPGMPQPSTPVPPPVQNSAALAPLVRPDVASASPGVVRPVGQAGSRRWLWFVIGACILFALLLATVFILVVVFMVGDVNQGKPIPGIDVTVRAPQAPDRATTEETAAKFVYRGLRNRGYESYPQPTWKIDVVIEKIGDERYEVDREVIVVDHIRTLVTIADRDGRNILTLEVPTEIPQNIEIAANVDAELATNKKMYSLAIMNLGTADFPTPGELEDIRDRGGTPE